MEKVYNNLIGGDYFTINKPLALPKKLIGLKYISPNYINSKKRITEFFNCSDQEIKDLEDTNTLIFNKLKWDDIPEDNKNYITYFLPGNPYNNKTITI